MDNKRVQVLGVGFDVLDWQLSLNAFERLLLTTGQHQVAKANPEFVISAREDPGVMTALINASMVLPDGVGVLWAAAAGQITGNGIVSYLKRFALGAMVIFAPKKVRTVLPQRIGGVEHIIDECRIVAKHGLGVFLLGASEASRVGAREFLSKQVPGLSIVGDAGSFTPDAEADRLVDAVDQSGAQFLIVCFGHPAQELWIARNLARMPRVKVADGEGGAFDFMAGVQRRAPVFMQKIGLEWIWRFLMNPIKRIKKLKTIWKFTGLVLTGHK